MALPQQIDRRKRLRIKTQELLVVQQKPSSAASPGGSLPKGSNSDPKCLLIVPQNHSGFCFNVKQHAKIGRCQQKDLNFYLLRRPGNSSPTPQCTQQSSAASGPHSSPRKSTRKYRRGGTQGLAGEGLNQFL